jgi:dual-specificity kinase
VAKALGGAAATELEEPKKRRARDEITHVQWFPGQMLGRYQVQKLLGDGTFGRVLEARDESNRTVAVKVIRDVKKYVEAAKIEAQVLKRMHQLGADQGTVKLLETFQEGTLFCLAFEPLGSSLYDLLKANKYRGFFMEDVQKFVHQIFAALAAIHKIRLTHTDLKPENVLLVHPETKLVEWPRGQGEKVKRPVDAHVKLIDFGGSTFSTDHHSSVINTRQYRAPEVTMGLGWEESSDMWSAGCLAAELYTGRMLFPTHDNLEHLAMMEASIGPIPRSMCERASSGAEKFVDGDRLRWPGDASKESRQAVHQCRRVEDYFLPRHRAFGDFLQFVLRINPKERPSARAAARNDFCSKPLPE